MSVNISNNLCGICLEDFVAHSDIGELQDCSHVFHRICVENWIEACQRNDRSPSCPQCRINITSINGVSINPHNFAANVDRPNRAHLTPGDWSAYFRYSNTMEILNRATVSYDLAYDNYRRAYDETLALRTPIIDELRSRHNEAYLCYRKAHDDAEELRRLRTAAGAQLGEMDARFQEVDARYQEAIGRCTEAKVRLDEIINASPSLFEAHVRFQAAAARSEEAAVRLRAAEVRLVEAETRKREASEAFH